MTTYDRILAFVTPDAQGRAVARQAAYLRRSHGAALAFAAVVDYEPGFECDHYPFHTPAEVRAAMVKDIEAKLRELAADAGAPDARIIVESGREAAKTSEIARYWQPDLIVCAQRKPAGLTAEGTAGWRCALATVARPYSPSLGSRVAGALAAAFG